MILCSFRIIHKSYSVGSLSNLFKINRSQRFYSPSMATKIMSLSESVRGMTQLDTEKFRKTITFPVLRVKSHDLNKIRGKVRLEKYLLKNLNNIKNVMDSEEETIKFLVFDPDVVNEEDLELKNTIIEQVKQVVEATPTWDNRVMDITFDNWDHRTIFRAILPDGLDFSSFTQTGHIIHCNFRDDLTPYKQIIGEVLLKKVKKCSTVVNKVDKISAEYRNFELELIAGEENYTTSVTERGITYFMDFSKVFWNSRLQHEHERVIQLLTKDSLVFDACAGIGPFVLPAAKQKRCKVVYANDLNPESIKWMNKNIEANKIVANQITTFNMDANDFIKGPVAKEIAKELSRPCDEDIQKIQGAHVLMNLPAFSVNFLPSFKGFLKDHLIVAPKSAAEFPVWVYSYLFVKAHEDVEPQWYVDRAIEMVKEKLGWTGDSCNTRIEVHHVRTVSTRKEMFCLRIDLPLGYLMDASISGLDEPPNKKQKV